MPVHKSEAQDEYEGATVIEPSRGSVLATHKQLNLVIEILKGSRTIPRSVNPFILAFL